MQPKTIKELEIMSFDGVVDYCLELQNAYTELFEAAEKAVKAFDSLMEKE